HRLLGVGDPVLPPARDELGAERQAVRHAGPPDGPAGRRLRRGTADPASALRRHAHVGGARSVSCCAGPVMTTDPWSNTGPLREDFAAPRDDRWFEDYRVGDVREYGTITVTEQQILDFARQFDPQLIHTDPEWAATGPFGGLIASGIQT